MPGDWCGRSVLYSWRQASSAACNASMLSNGPCASSSSRWRVWCSRSMFPVVVAEWILVSRRVCRSPGRSCRTASPPSPRACGTGRLNTLPLSSQAVSSDTMSGPCASQAQRAVVHRAIKPSSGAPNGACRATSPARARTQSPWSKARRAVTEPPLPVSLQTPWQLEGEPHIMLHRPE